MTTGTSRHRPAALGRGEDAGGVGADREEGGIAEVEQTAVADHDVETDREHDEDQRIGRDPQGVGRS
jgi:hypothetical protein